MYFLKYTAINAKPNSFFTFSLPFDEKRVKPKFPDEAFTNFLGKTGCSAYNPRMMMKIILCAYTQSVFSSRKVEALLKDSIRMISLAQGYEPSYRTITRFRINLRSYISEPMLCTNLLYN